MGSYAVIAVVLQIV